MVDVVLNKSSLCERGLVECNIALFSKESTMATIIFIFIFITLTTFISLFSMFLKRNEKGEAIVMTGATAVALGVIILTLATRTGGMSVEEVAFWEAIYSYLL